MISFLFSVVSEYTFGIMCLFKVDALKVRRCCACKKGDLENISFLCPRNECVILPSVNFVQNKKVSVFVVTKP